LETLFVRAKHLTRTHRIRKKLNLTEHISFTDDYGNGI